MIPINNVVVVQQVWEILINVINDFYSNNKIFYISVNDIETIQFI